MKYLTLLGFDYGWKSIGVAVGRTFSREAQGLEAVAARNGQPDWQKLDKLVAEWAPDELIVGLPLNMDGTEQRTTKQSRAFGKQLQARYNLPLHFVDERLTSRAARDGLEQAATRRSKLKQATDMLSAQLILQTWLNT